MSNEIVIINNNTMRVINKTKSIIKLAITAKWLCFTPALLCEQTKF
jgi:hypothetical protein